MTDYSRQDIHSASEDTAYLSGSYSPVASKVDQWFQFGPFQPLTPPDSNSDCSSDGPYEHQDMSSQTWSQASQPDGSWTAAVTQDDSRHFHVPVTGVQSQWYQPTSQSLDVMEGPSFPNMRLGSVDDGLSPVLSLESQSSHTLNSFRESDFPMLPAGLDLSFATEPQWIPNQSGFCTSQGSPQTVMSGNCFVTSSSQDAVDIGLDTSMTQWNLTPGADQLAPRPFFPDQGGHAAYVRGPVAYRTVAQKRQLLPRTEGPAVSSQQVVHAPQGTARPQMPGHSSSSQAASNVSSALDHHQVDDRTREAQGPCAATSQDVISPAQGPTLAVPPIALESTHQNRPQASLSHFGDLSDDFSDIIQYDDDDANTVQGSASLIALQMAEPSPAMQSSNTAQDTLSAMAKQEPESKPMSDSPAVTTLSSDGDEGRYRNHPLYSQGPAQDGLYYCPWANEQEGSCPHKATKLKCNYDKYIDSHLKPFRCKVESCAKQEFSSTACLLRHEREAHGMHGHGERPHLCFYASCERSTPGNGFPRRYNLFDHMKRVHDHKEESQTANTSSEARNGERRATPRKRKASGPPPSTGPPLQRNRSAALPARRPEIQVQPMPALPAGYQQQQSNAPHGRPVARIPTQERRDSHSNKHQLYSQWASQKEMIARQMESMNPDDINDATIQCLNDNVQELRRLSEEARRG